MGRNSVHICIHLFIHPYPGLPADSDRQLEGSEGQLEGSEGSEGQLEGSEGPMEGSEGISPNSTGFCALSGLLLKKRNRKTPRG